MARSERFELPTLGIEIRCSIQLSYERVLPGDGRASEFTEQGAGSFGDIGISREDCGAKAPPRRLRQIGAVITRSY